MSETRTRVLQWFVSGGVVTTPDGAQVIIDVDPIVVGRDPGTAIVLGDPEVSAFHCELRAVSDGILVKDLGSTNGTYLGPIRVREAVVATAVEITVGASRLSLVPQAKHRVDVGFADRFGPLVGLSPKMRRIFGVLEKVANTTLSVLIFGEAGTGKELAARALHEASARRGAPFVVVDCGSIPPGSAESILFGQEKGPGGEARAGILAEAAGGTVFFDELGELPIEVQPKLLRALRDGHVRRAEGKPPEPIDVRVLGGTRRDLGAEMNASRFRSDLFFQVGQVRVELPALRDRTTDLPILVEDVCRAIGKPENSDAVLAWIQRRMGSYDWPGNVRELCNVASVAATLAEQPGAIDDVLLLVRDEQTAEGHGAATAFGAAKRTAIAGFEREYFTGLARRCKGNVSEMARQSGMERHHVRAYLRKYAIDKSLGSS